MADLRSRVEIMTASKVGFRVHTLVPVRVKVPSQVNNLLLLQRNLKIEPSGQIRKAVRPPSKEQEEASMAAQLIFLRLCGRLHVCWRYAGEGEALAGMAAGGAYLWGDVGSSGATTVLLGVLLSVVATRPSPSSLNGTT